MAIPLEIPRWIRHLYREDRIYTDRSRHAAR